ncbi:MAG: hypothetical protein HC906_16550 [Bacteroidales bacterium]|nr:hypothetical protein [Bacteroidales bacterium]
MGHKEKELFCARDHFGVRPFYYSFDKGSFYFGSELRFIKAIRFDNKTCLNTEFWLDTLVTSISEKQSTAFDGVFRLPPASSLFYSNGKIEIEKYWELNFHEKIRFKSTGQYISLFRKKLIEAVELRCKNSGIIGSELSGGLDSSTVTCIANNFIKKRKWSALFVFKYSTRKSPIRTY